MDRLTAFVAIAHLKLRLDLLLKYPHLLEKKKMPTPNLQGLTKAMDMLEHDLETDAGGLMNKIQQVGVRGKAAIAKGHVRVDGVASRVGQVEKFVTAIEGSNGGDPLDGSSNSSGTSSQQEQPKGETQVVAAADVGKVEDVVTGVAEPAASWGGQK